MNVICGILTRVLNACHAVNTRKVVRKGLRVSSRNRDLIREKCLTWFAEASEKL